MHYNSLRLGGVIEESIVDGPDIRYVLFTQGCEHNCRGCHNPQTHDINGGYVLQVSKIYDDILKNSHTKNITFSGGEPFMQAASLSDLATSLKNKGFNIVTYTGFTFEYLHKYELNYNGWRSLLYHTDILVDGKYEEDKRDLTLQFRGSSNQRIIDVQKSLKSNSIIEYIL